MSQAENLIQRLAKVRGRNGSWTARCPAHDDRGPSLSVRELPDGRVLVHCFAGCEVRDVLRSVGLDLQDLFPDKAEHARPGGFIASDILRVIEFEALVVQTVAYDMSQGKTISESDRKRLGLACERIFEALRYVKR